MLGGFAEGLRASLEVLGLRPEVLGAARGGAGGFAEGLGGWTRERHRRKCDVIVPIMTARAWGFVVAVLAVGGLGVPALAGAQESSSSERNLRAERVAVTLVAQADGSVDVREEIVLRIGRERTSRFERQISKAQSDGIVNVVAAVDGVVSPPGGAAGQVEVSEGRSVRVRWRFPNASNTAKTFTLSYRAVNAVAPRGARAMFRWPAVSGNRAYPVAQASVSFDAPAGALFFDGTGVEEAGWVIARRGDGFVAHKDNLGRREGGTFVAEFSADGLRLVEPQWQFDQQRAVTLMPAFLSAGLFILVVGVGILWIIRFQHPSLRLPTGEADAPVVDLPTGLALAVAARRYPNHQDLPLGTLADLVRRGIVRPTSSDAKTLTFESQGSSTRLLAHEALVLAEVGRTDEGPLTFERLHKQLVRLLSPYRKALMDDLVAAGYADADRIDVASGLVRGGLATLLLGLVTLGAVLFWMSRFGPWPLAIPAAIVVVGLGLIVRGAAFSVLTQAGEQVSAGWRRRLKAVLAMKPPVAGAATGAMGELRRWLPEAVASGQGATFAKKVDKHRSLPEVLGLTKPAFAPHE